MSYITMLRNFLNISSQSLLFPYSRLSLFAALIFAMILAGCNGRSDNAVKPISDSEIQAAVDADSDVAEVYTLSKDSIGPIAVAMPVAMIPKSVPGLFDDIVVTPTPDATAYTFILETMPQFTVYDFMNGSVDVIALESNACGVQTPSGLLRVGDPFSRVLELPGVRAEWQGFDDMGLWYWNWNGLWFAVDETDLPDAAANALYNDKRPPHSADIPQSVKIGYIGTGLPF